MEDVNVAVIHGGSRLGERLVDAKVLTDAQVTTALAEQERTGKRLGTVLVESGAIDERTLLSALGMQLDIPVVDLRHHAPSADALQRVPELLVRELNALPLHRRDGALEIVVAEPPDETAANELCQAAGAPLHLMLAPAEDIRRAIDAAYAGLAELSPELERNHANGHASAVSPLLVVDPRQPAEEIVEALIAEAWHARASDVHLEPQPNGVRVRYRVDGALRDAALLPLEQGWDVLDRAKSLARLDLGETRRAQLGGIDMEIDDQRLDVRLATMSTIWGERGAMHLLAPERSPYRLEELGMPERPLNLLRRVARDPAGLVVCAGPMGSGRTATLYAALAEANTPDRCVMTVERRLDYIIDSANQMQVGGAAELSMADGLRAALHHDADVILVGEIADAETAQLTAEASVGGRFVLAAMHAGDAAGAVRRLLDMHVEVPVLASSLVAVVAQRLVRRVCTGCAAPYVPPSAELAYYRHRTQVRKTLFVHGEGCDACGGTGYRGRTGIFEVLRVGDNIRDVIATHASEAQLREHAIREGMSTLQEEGLRLVTEDTTTISEIIRSLSALEVQR